MVSYHWIVPATLLFTAFFAVSYGQDQQRIAGIKYVEPLNNRAGEDENDRKLFDCYRCNRYKGGGAACPETLRQIPGQNVPEEAPPAGMIVRSCEVCLKVKTTMYYRNRDYIVDKLRVQNVDHFESRQVISRTCIEDKKDARLTSGCISEDAAGGTVQRCYCQGHLCNTSSIPTLSYLLAMCAALISACHIF